MISITLKELSDTTIIDVELHQFYLEKGFNAKTTFNYVFNKTKLFFIRRYEFINLSNLLILPLSFRTSNIKQQQLLKTKFLKKFKSLNKNLKFSFFFFFDTNFSPFSKRKNRHIIEH